MLASMSNAAGSVCLVAAACVGAAGSGCSIAAVCVGAAECLVQYNHYTIKFSKNYQIITRWEYEPA